MNTAYPYKFMYPLAFVTLPKYSQHRNMDCRIIRLLNDDEADTLEETMYLIECVDGWQGHAFESELQRKEGE